MLVLRPGAESALIQTIPAVMALVRRGVGPLAAKRAIEACRDAGRTVVPVPLVEDRGLLAHQLGESGVSATFLDAAEVDVREIRRRLGLTQEQFALRYGLDLRSLQNWETGRRKPDAAVRSYLKVIDRLPEPVSRALEDRGSPA